MLYAYINYSHMSIMLQNKKNTTSLLEDCIDWQDGSSMSPTWQYFGRLLPVYVT